MKNKTNKEALKNPWFYVSVIAVLIIIVLGYMLVVPKTGETVRQKDAEELKSSPSAATASAGSYDDFDGELCFIGGLYEYADL